MRRKKRKRKLSSYILPNLHLKDFSLQFITFSMSLILFQSEDVAKKTVRNRKSVERIEKIYHFTSIWWLLKPVLVLLNWKLLSQAFWYVLRMRMEILVGSSVSPLSSCDGWWLQRQYSLQCEDSMWQTYLYTFNTSETKRVLPFHL